MDSVSADMHIDFAKALTFYISRVIAMAADGPAGRYSRPSPDGRIPGTFMVNALRPREM